MTPELISALRPCIGLYLLVVFAIQLPLIALGLALSTYDEISDMDSEALFMTFLIPGVGLAAALFLILRGIYCRFRYRNVTSTKETT